MPKHFDKRLVAKASAALQQYHRPPSETVTAKEAVNLLLPDIRDALARGLSMPEVSNLLHKHLPGIAERTFGNYVATRALRREASRAQPPAGKRKSA